MKMSVFWFILLVADVGWIISDITNNTFGLWFYINIVGTLAAAYFVWDALRTEKREAAEKKQFFNIVINHMGTEPADVTAKRVADLSKWMS
jgi:hypothetical protein